MSLFCPLSIDLSEDEDFIQKRIANNASTADTVEIVCSFRVDDGEEEQDHQQGKAMEDMVRICRSIGEGLKNLRNIFITVDHEQFAIAMGDTAPFPTEALCHLLELRKSSLVSLKLLWGLQLVGSRLQFQKAFTILSECKMMKCFKCHCRAFDIQDLTNNSDTGNLQGEDLSDTWGTNLLLGALGKVQSLQELSVTALPLSISSDTALAKLCQNKPSFESLSLFFDSVDLSDSIIEAMFDGQSRVTSLHLVEIPGINSHAASIVQALETNTVVKKFCVFSSEEPTILTSQNGIALLKALRSNDTLQRIELSFASGPDCQYEKPLADAIQKLSVKELSLDVFDRNSSRMTDAILSLLKGLKVNQTLTKLELNLCDEDLNDVEIGFGANDSDTEVLGTKAMSEKINNELSNALQDNYSMQEAAICRNDFDNIEISDDVSFWLELNHIDRYYLEMHSDQRNLWVDMIIDQKDDVRIVYYFLTKNPILLCHCPPFSAGSSKKRKRNQEQRVDIRTVLYKRGSETCGIL